MPLVKYGGRQLLLSPSDLVLPLCCGLFLHLFFVIALFLTHYKLQETECNTAQDKDLLYWYIYCALGCHALIVLINFIGASIAFRLKVMNYSIWLTRILYIRSLLNFIDIAIAIWGLYLIIAGYPDCLDNTTYLLLVISVSINWFILVIGCCGVCCLSISEGNNKDKALRMRSNDINSAETLHGIRASSMRNLHENEATTKKIESRLRKVCCACLWEHKAWNHGEVASAFTEMGGLMQILIQTHHIQNENIQNLAPSDILTGLQLYRMLQKHYQLHDLGFYHPYKASNYTHKV